MRIGTVGLAAALLLAIGGCKSSPHRGPGGAGSSAPSRDPGSCGANVTDWCPSPPADPCGAHRDTASCRADPRCGGMPYRGESVVACQFDARGFGLNCPTVGCISRPK